MKMTPMRMCADGEEEPTAVEDGDDADDGVGASDGGRSVQLPKVEVLTSETASAHSLDEVVLPFPGGSRVQYPANAMRAEYMDFIGKMGLSVSDMESAEGLFNLVGGYRRIIVKPRDLQW